MRHRRPRRHPRCPAILEQCVKILHERRNLLLSRLWFLLRRHLAAVDLIERLCPLVAVQPRIEVARQPIDPDIPLFLLRAMTADAVILQKRLKRFRRADGTNKSEAKEYA